jgi:peptidoglycan/LPS O-acetylase OafA/YrhL
MGVLRIYLALCVVAAHAGVSLLPWPMHDSVEAVQIFFIISGFYMALISEKYKTALEFYASRFLRIFIPYYVILGIVLIVCVVCGLALGQWLDLSAYVNYSPDKNGLTGVIFTAITNLTVFFQDWVMFLQHDAGTSFSFTTKFTDDASPLYQYLLVRQAWSIGIELVFYLLVPLLSKLKTRWLVVIALVSLALRIYVYQDFNLSKDPFSYRFFPFELLLFLAGMIAYRVYSRTIAHWEFFKLKNIAQYLAFFVFMLALFYFSQKIPGLLKKPLGRAYMDLATYPLWVILIPFLFHLTKDLKLDRFIGELTYPVYLLHFVVLEAVIVVLQSLSLTDHLSGIITAAVTVALSVFLYVIIFKPFEERRQGFAKELSERWGTLLAKRQKSFL